jgi:hypothetical protein
VLLLFMDEFRLTHFRRTVHQGIRLPERLASLSQSLSVVLTPL